MDHRNVQDMLKNCSSIAKSNMDQFFDLQFENNALRRENNALRRENNNIEYKNKVFEFAIKDVHKKMNILNNEIKRLKKKEKEKDCKKIHLNPISEIGEIEIVTVESSLCKLNDFLKEIKSYFFLYFSNQCLHNSFTWIYFSTNNTPRPSVF